jgi:hypothetical protein
MQFHRMIAGKNDLINHQIMQNDFDLAPQIILNNQTWLPSLDIQLSIR